MDRFLVDRLLRPGYRLLLAAYKGVGKTYVGLQMAFTFASPEVAGKLFGEFEVQEPLTCVYIDQEVGQGELLRRVDTLAGELAIERGEYPSPSARAGVSCPSRTVAT